MITRITFLIIFTIGFHVSNAQMALLKPFVWGGVYDTLELPVHEEAATKIWLPFTHPSQIDINDGHWRKIGRKLYTYNIYHEDDKTSPDREVLYLQWSEIIYDARKKREHILYLNSDGVSEAIESWEYKTIRASLHKKFGEPDETWGRALDYVDLDNPMSFGVAVKSGDADIEEVWHEGKYVVKFGWTYITDMFLYFDHGKRYQRKFKIKKVKPFRKR